VRLSYRRFVRLVAVIIFFTSLALPAYAGKMEEHRTIDTTHPRARLIIGSDGLADNIKLIKARVAPVGRFMRGQISVQNLTDLRLVLEAKFDWVDDEGFLVGDGGIWERFTLGPRGMKALKSLGKSRNAAKVQVTVRYPGDTLINSPQD